MVQFLFRFLILSISFGIVPLIETLAQDKRVLDGIVLDFAMNQPIPGANVYWEEDLVNGVTTDSNGEFQIQVNALPAKLVISFVGFEVVVRVIQDKDILKPLNFFLRLEDMDLEEVTVSSTRPDENV